MQAIFLYNDMGSCAPEEFFDILVDTVVDDVHRGAPVDQWFITVEEDHPLYGQLQSLIWELEQEAHGEPR